MAHRADNDFWDKYRALPLEVRSAARKNYRLLLANPRHPSLHFKKIRTKDLWSVRIGSYRALAYEEGSDFIWFWIGPHDEYERMIRG